MHWREKAAVRHNIQVDIDVLIELCGKYSTIEQKIICSNLEFCGADMVNLLDIYQLLPIPVRNGMHQASAYLCLSELESWSAECLAIFLADILKDQVPYYIQVHWVDIDMDVLYISFSLFRGPLQLKYQSTTRKPKGESKIIIHIDKVL